MYKLKKLNIFNFATVLFLILTSSVFAQTTSYKCTNPTIYGLDVEDVNRSNSSFYCWEIKYLKEYQNRLSMTLSSYYNLFPKDISSENIEKLRELGITPEKSDYLYKYFIDTPINEKKSYEKIIKSAISKAQNDLSDKSQYVYGRPIWYADFLNPIDGVASFFKNLDFSKGPYKRFFKVLGESCYPKNADKKAFDVFPYGLQPVGIIGRYFINAFGEIVAEIKEVKNGTKIENKIYLVGSTKSIGTWNDNKCKITDISKNIKRTFSCTACTMFEIAFNTVSKIGFILYDKLARYTLYLMTGMFLIWVLFMFFDNAIKKQDGEAFTKTFFSKAMWVFIVSAFLSVSITDENNIINYTVRPLTDFMTGYNKMMTKAIDKDNKPWECRYASKDIEDNAVIFSKEIKTNIVCTIERIGDFNNLNIEIGKQQVLQGWRQILNLEVANGGLKIFLGITIMALFFMLNLTVPFFFIESLFKIAIVVFLFPLILAGYVFDKKGKGFVQKALDTFLFAIFQLISLSIMCSVISLLMSYISTIDFYALQDAIVNSNGQEMTSQMLLIFSFNTNKLLEIIYTSLICWYLMGQALTIANNKFTGYASQESLPRKFIDWGTNIVKTSTSVVVDKFHLKQDAGALATKLKKAREEEINQSQGGRNV